MRVWGLLRGLGLGALVVATGCGGSNRVLESITVNSVTSANGTSFTATGHYSADPMTVNNIPVAWFQTGVVVDPGPKNWEFTQSTSPMTGQCYGSDTANRYYVIAYASANPDAPSSESMPFTVFESLVEMHGASPQDNFVAGSTQFTCAASVSNSQ